MPAGLQADRRGERDGLLDRLALLGRRLRPRQPGVDQDRQVLLVLLLEFLDHQLAALRAEVRQWIQRGLSPDR